jgi:hypothetical protein
MTDSQKIIVDNEVAAYLRKFLYVNEAPDGITWDDIPRVEVPLKPNVVEE